MNYQSKLKQNRIFCIIFLLCLCVIVANINFQHENDIFDQLDKPNQSDSPLYHLEWSLINSSVGYCWDMAMSSSEDIYMVCDGPSSGNSAVVKYDKNANFQWETTADGDCRSIALDSSNNVYVSGYNSDWNMILTKISSSGVLQWSRILDKRDYDQIFAVAVDGSSNVYMAGMSYDYDENRDIILVKYSSSGTYLWDRTLDIRDEDFCRGLTTDSSNNIYLVGHHRDFSTSDDIFIAKYSSSGTFQWSTNWGVWYQDDEAQDIVLDSSNNIFVTGSTYESSTNDDVVLIKFNSAGNLQWSQRWGGTGTDVGYSIDLSSDGDVFIGGATYEQSAGLFDILLMVYNSAGSLKWCGRWGESQHDMGRGIAITPTKQVYIGGDRDDDLTLLKYELAPSVTINSPSPNSLYSFTAPSFNVDITDSNLIEKYYTVNDGAQYTFSGSTGTINQAAWNACPHGTVSLKFYGRDSSGSVYEEVVVRKDIVAPDFEISSPTTFQICTDTAPNYQLTTSDTDVDGIWYTLNGGGNIVVSSLTGVINQVAWDALDNGSVLIEFFLEDNIGNIASKSVEVYKNYEIPLISINSPLPNQFCGLKTISYSIETFTLWSIDEMWFSLNGGQNITISETDGTIDQIAWDLCGNGTVTITFYAKNSLGYVGNAEAIVRKDIYFPFIDIYAPIASQKYGISSPYYNVSITSVTLDSKWYSLNYGDDIHFLDDVSIIDKSAWDTCANGTVVITFYANNTGGITNSKEISIYKDVRRPNITIISPNSEVLYGLETIGFNIIIDEPQLDNTWYSLNGGMNYSFVGTSGVIDQGGWDSCGNGTVTISFYANNSFGNVGIAEIIVRKDVYFPFITILSPESEQLCGINAPNYNFSIFSLNVDSMWYSLNDGINYTILTTVGIIDQLYWDSYGNENVTITFYANNSNGQLNFESVKIIKDIPQIIIHSPTSSQLIGRKAPLFNISIDETFLHKSWYSLNDNRNYTFSGYSGRINQEIWDLCSNGTVKITFYANNTANNIGKAEIFIQKDISILSAKIAYAIVIGVENYPGSSYDLDYCRDDAEDVYSFLISNCNFEPENIILLLDSNATNSAIKNAFSQTYYKITSEDLFLFYFSGHGGDHSTWGEYLCPYDSIEPFNPSHTYFDYVLEARLDSLNCAEKFVLTDACNSGGMIFECQATGTYMMTSCMDYEISYESSNLEHGIFTYYFLRSLNYASDSNNDGIISLEEQYHYVYSNVFRESGYDSRPQESDRITGESVLYPGIGSFTFTPYDNYLNITFYIYGNGMINCLNITICSVIINITIKTVDILEVYAISNSGFGFYELSLELPNGCNVTGCEIFIEVEGFNIVIFKERYGDYDGDGLTDLFEIYDGGGLDPTTNDTDNDGLSDYDEFCGNTDPMLSDSDYDGLLDGEEVNIYNTDPTLSDTDHDGLLDGEEINTFNTDPLVWDTDQDGYSDGDEVLIYHTDPLDPDSYPRPETSPPFIPGYNWLSLISMATLSILLIRKVKSLSKLNN